ncbi:SIR2 family NAD-dependent protein deacylase [Desulfovermiculus halophilus]|jgi:NAD-dependent deacetylase|uniref:SIR2 family NAD-dependent protein deacylase n=1 Tax=Desulfovermiculus halophilus TaxID=339722 RepID=UPI000486A459|nr:NAD-dependent deacylase [Desulfovermiculus halophilus]
MTSESEKAKLQEAAALLQHARTAVAFTGAGISVPSGIPDFRSPGGLWTKYDPFEVASAHALDHNPRKVWEFMLETVDLLGRSQPNPGHLALADLETNSRLSGVITQNIDNLHQRAGSRLVVEYHGNFQRFYCHGCLRECPEQEVMDHCSRSIPVYCPSCGGLVRPDVVFFGEAIPAQAHQHSLELIQAADVLIIVGTSGEVAPANVLPRQVKLSGGKIIEVNLGQTHYADITDIRFDASAEQVLPQLAAMVLE